MLIQCPSCGTRAKLPDSKEGAKVRCPECSFVYVARPPGGSGGGKSGSRTSNSSLPIAVGAGIVGLVILLIYLTNSGKQPAAAPDLDEPPVREVVHDSTGWSSPLVMVCRALHERAFARDDFQLEKRLDLPRVWARATAPEGEEGDPTGWTSLTIEEQIDFKTGVFDALKSEDPENLIGAWEPFDGEVVLERDADAVVHVKVEPRAPGAGLEFRWVEWRLVKHGEEWRAWSWERWISPAEQKAQRVARAKKIEKKTLSDGSFVIEAEPGPIPYLDETPPEERERIETLIDHLVDLDRFDQFETHRELEAIGKPAIPGLLTRMYTMYQGGLDTEEEWTRIGLVHQALGNITAYVTTFKPSEALGATKERQISGLKQWFGWYHRKFRRFDVEKLAAEEIDLLEEALQPRNEREARELERALREQEQEEIDRKRREARGGGR